MKKSLLFISVFSLTILISAQNSRLEKKITPISNNLYQIVEKSKKDTIIIGTLSSIDPEIRHGEFYFYNKNGGLDAKGSYMDNIPSGIWSYYDKNGNIIKEINYQNIIEFLNTDTLQRTSEALFISENMPEFNGGSQDNFRIYIQQNLIYPIYAMHSGKEGRVFISFTVNEEGMISHVSVAKSSGDLDLNMEALRVIIESPKWTPGRQRGKAVPVMFTFPINFVL